MKNHDLARRLRSGEPVRLAVMGLSGVGKTRLARVLPSEEWFHYSADYRIWTHYLGDDLNDYLKTLAMEHPLLANLLRHDAITVEHRVHFDNLLATSLYMGMLGSPGEYGSTIEGFTARMAKHAEAERAAVLDIPHFIHRAKELYGYRHFIADCGGSLCEVIDPTDTNDPILRALSDEVTLVYIRATKEHQTLLEQRNAKDPKPLYYRPDFIEAELPGLLQEMGQTDITQISPKDIGRYLFPRLLDHRIARYEAIAEHHAITISMDEASSITSQEELLELLTGRM